uniref:Pre-mRNA-splicing factor Syf1/CRNKL1-like C-terminal HAT-repeats domain-containing protein n=1 Tax=Solanum lycopersicum TaxID=4081 RepID=A0A3Q7G5W4_SOLLC
MGTSMSNSSGLWASETMNICSKCYKDMISKKEQANFTTSSIDRFVNGSSSASVKAVDVVVTVQEGPAESLVIPTQVAAPVENVQVEKAKEGPNRCSTCRRQTPGDAVKPLYLQYAKLEEDYGLAKRAMRVYDQATKVVLANEKLSMYKIYIARAAEIFGVPRTWEIYEQEIESNFQTRT